MDDLSKVFEVYKLNDGSYLVKIDLSSCEYKKEDNLIMSYKDKSEEEEVDDLFISAKTEKEVSELILKYLPMIVNKTEQEIIESYEETFKKVKV